jgi:hypothetical protein
MARMASRETEVKTGLERVRGSWTLLLLVLVVVF